MTEQHDRSESNLAETALALYQLDSEFYRHQDSLMWGRFQTAATVEGAVLFALFGLEHRITEPTRSILMVAGMLLVAVICCIGLKDAADARFHLKRLREFEDLRNIVSRGGELGLGLGFWLMALAMTIVNLTNFLILCRNFS